MTSRRRKIDSGLYPDLSSEKEQAGNVTEDEDPATVVTEDVAHSSPDANRLDGSSTEAQQFDSDQDGTLRRDRSPRRPTRCSPYQSATEKLARFRDEYQKRLARPPLHPDGGATDTHTESPPSHWGYWLIWLILLSVIGIICRVLLDADLWSNHERQPVAPVRPTDANVVFNKELTDMKMKWFPHQNSSTWTSLRAATRLLFPKSSSVVVDATAPVTIVVGGVDEQSIGCFVRRFADVCAAAFGTAERYTFQEIDGAQLSSVQGMEQKALREHLEKTLGEFGTRATVIHHIDKLQSDVPLVFNSHCDLDHAPFKDAVILLTTVSPRFNDGKCDQGSVHELIVESWTKGGLIRDKVASVWSRIGNTVVCIVTEPTVQC